MKTSLSQITQTLSIEQILAGYDQVSQLYPYIPSLSICRSWEYAAYRRYHLQEPVLDVGCGDGRLFHLVWPNLTEVYGVDIDQQSIEQAREIGIYRNVWQVNAATMQFEQERFASVFANSSLEHMSQLPDVLQNIFHLLQPGGLFVFSIFTNKIADWFSPAILAKAFGAPELAQHLYQDWINYHHLVNPLSVEGWCMALEDAGFEVIEHVPVMTEICGRLFLLADGLWHLHDGESELGEHLFQTLSANPESRLAFRAMLHSTLIAETNQLEGCAAVLVARRPGEQPTTISYPTRSCWCGAQQLNSFSPDYGFCATCGTLVSQTGLRAEQTQVQDDEQDFYGRNYWLSHMPNQFGLPDIITRARQDLPERCLYWLRHLLNYKLPPAQVLELGSAHGGFVALARWAGFKATGLELSPWVVEFAQKTFETPMLLGMIEEQDLTAGTFDAIVLNDVLEHLDQPLDTLRRCTELLSPDGLLFIQTPGYPEPLHYEEMVRNDTPFLQMMEVREHLYLFSRRSIKRLCSELGLPHVIFLPALFPYDIMFIASRTVLPRHTNEAISAALLASPSGRLMLALLDKETEAAQQRSARQQMETHAAARLEVIQQLQQALDASEADRAARLEVIHDLKAHLEASEADRRARLEVINQLNSQLIALEQMIRDNRA